MASMTAPCEAIRIIACFQVQRLLFCLQLGLYKRYNISSDDIDGQKTNGAIKIIHFSLQGSAYWIFLRNKKKKTISVLPNKACRTKNETRSTLCIQHFKKQIMNTIVAAASRFRNQCDRVCGQMRAKLKRLLNFACFYGRAEGEYFHTLTRACFVG